MHPDDLERFGIRHDTRVTVRSDTGSMPNILARGFDAIRSGNALMYYPESNILVSRHADPSSKTPAFKGVVVRIETEG
jgi:anaerobic selenocysteine-containing dehydrogenase